MSILTDTLNAAGGLRDDMKCPKPAGFTNDRGVNEAFDLKVRPVAEPAPVLMYRSEPRYKNEHRPSI